MENVKYILLGTVLLLVTLCEAHICLFNPRQRGTMNGINAAGSNDCILLDGPCGGRDPEKPVTGILTGEPYSVIFQKNLNHFNPAEPGMFVVSVGVASETPEFQQLGAPVPDSNTSSLHVYELEVTFPGTMASESAIVQVKYVTNNPKVPPVFYQCADVFLL